MVNWGYFTPLSEGYYALLTTGFPGPPCVLPEFHYLYIYFSSAAIHLSNHPSIHTKIGCGNPEQESQKSCGMVQPHCEVVSHLGLGKNDISSLEKKVPSHLKRCHIPIGNDRLPTIHFQVRTVRFGDDSWKTTSGFLQGAAFYVNVQQEKLACEQLPGSIYPPGN